MQLPSEIEPSLKKYAQYVKDEDLFEELKKNPSELISFFHYACADETWAEEHSTILKSILSWLTEENIMQNFPNEFFQPIIDPLHKHIHVLKPTIPLDLLVKVDQEEYSISSLLLSIQSSYFRRRILHERRGKNPVLKIYEIPLSFLKLVDEFIISGEIKDLWKMQPDELWALIDALNPLDLFPIVEACEVVLRRYIDRSNAFDMLIKAHQKHLQLLQNVCEEFINDLDRGVRLVITPVENLSLEFLDYKDNAFVAFNKVKDEMTHLIFSGEMAVSSQFKLAVNSCPKLKGLDLSDSIGVSYLESIPDHVQELYLSRCRWINNAEMQTLSLASPDVIKLDLSNNDQLTYAIWSELRRFKNLTSLDVSRCFQIGDNELRIILQACPKLLELKMVDCQKISPDGFFEIGKLVPGLSLLNLSRTLVSDAALIDILVHCKSLLNLDISRCYGVSDKGVLEGIRHCPSLKTIHLTNTGLTLSGIEQIKKHYPSLNIL